MRIEVIPSYAVVPTGRARHLHTLVRIGADEGATPDDLRPPLALALVIDRSSSMRGRPLRHAAEAARLVGSRLAGEDRLCVVTFDREVTTLFGPDVLNEHTRARLDDRLDFLMSGYLTNLGGGLAEACKQMAPFCRSGMTSRVILLTDGLPSYGVRDGDELCELASFYREFGIVICAVGLGPGFDQELLTRLVTRGGGSFRFAKTSDELPAALGAELAELFALRAANTEVRVAMTDAASGVDILHAYAACKKGRQVIVEVGEVYSGAPRLLLLDFAIPVEATRRSGELRVATLNIRYQNPGGRISEEAVPINVDVQQGVEPVMRSDVRRELAMMQAAKAERDAVRRADAGDLRGAREILRQAAEALRTEPSLQIDVALRRKLAELSDASDRLRMGEFSASQRKSMVASAWRTQVSRVEPLPTGPDLTGRGDDIEDPDEGTNI